MPVEMGGRQYGVVAGRPPSGGARQPTYADRMLVSDLNRCLLGDEVALAKLRKVIRTSRRRFLFGIISGAPPGRGAEADAPPTAFPSPTSIVTSTGTSITYLPKLVEDVAWTRRIERQWTPQVVRRVLADVPGLAPRERAQQSEFKIGYVHDPALAPLGRGDRGDAVPRGAGGQRVPLARTFHQRRADPCLQGAGDALPRLALARAARAGARDRRLGGGREHDARQQPLPRWSGARPGRSLPNSPRASASTSPTPRLPAVSSRRYSGTTFSAAAGRPRRGAAGLATRRVRVRTRRRDLPEHGVRSSAAVLPVTPWNVAAEARAGSVDDGPGGTPGTRSGGAGGRRGGRADA